VEDAARELLARGAAETGVTLDNLGEDRFSLYAELLQRWGRKMNLTSRLETKEIVTTHFLDSLAALPLLAGASGTALVDIGSGAGFPSLPLKICLPRLSVVLVESAHKKVSFCREVIRRLDLAGATVVEGRGEEASGREDLAGAFDWAVVRAVGEAAKMARIAFPFLRPGGTLILYKGIPGEEELLSLKEESALLGAEFTLRPVQVPSLDAHRTLVLVRKCFT
jgi:16S rRNA (guanine527-N7)-methyltransferase